MTSDGTYNSRGNEEYEYVSQSLSIKSENGHVLHPGLHLHRQLLGDGPHTICSPRHHQLQVVQDHQGETINYFLSKFLRTIILQGSFTFVYKYSFDWPAADRQTAGSVIKIELYPVYQSQDNVFVKGNFKDFSGTDPE